MNDSCCCGGSLIGPARCSTCVLRRLKRKLETLENNKLQLAVEAACALRQIADIDEEILIINKGISDVQWEL